MLAEHQLSAVSWADLRAALFPATHAEEGDELDDDDDEDWEDDATMAAPAASGVPREQLMRSPMLLSSLEQVAQSANPQAHFLLASLYRCGRPNPYLYEESIKGRVLTTIERGWVDDYLRLEPQFRKYEAHLKAAALGGIRAAALEYGTAFENPEFIALAERLTGEVDALKMARLASSAESRERWLRTAAEQGSNGTGSTRVPRRCLGRGSGRGVGEFPLAAICRGTGTRRWGCRPRMDLAVPGAGAWGGPHPLDHGRVPRRW